MLNIAALPLYTFCEVKLNMWSWNQCVLMVSCQSPGTLLICRRCHRASPALGSVAAVLMLLKPARTMGQW